MAKKGGGAVTQPFQSNSSSNFSNTGTSTSTVNTPEGYVDSWRGFQPGAGGFNPLQQAGANWLSGALNNPDPANLGAARPYLTHAAGYFADTLNNRTNPTLRNLAAIDPAAYGAPADVVAQNVAARRGSEFMGDYQSPYTKDVIDTSLAQFDYDAGKARAALMGQNAGAFANKRFGLAEGEFAANTVRDRASLGAGLRDRGFTTAASLGMQDAGRFLAADTGNADRALAAATFNNQQRQARNMFDAQQGMAYNEQRDRTARDLGAISGQLAGLGVTGFDINKAIAGGLIDAGALGQNQNLAWLGAGLPLFGQTNESANTGTTTGTSSGTTTGRGSSKGGGLEIGPIKLGGS